MPDPGRPPIPREAFAQVRERLRPTLLYLDRLRARLERRGYLPGDPLMRAVLDAYDRMYALVVQLHYASVASGVGRAEE